MTWEVKPLGEVLDMYQPKTLAKKNLKGGPFKVYGANGVIGTHDEFNHENCEVVLGCRGSCGEVHMTDSCSWINGNAMVMRPKDLSQLSVDFLFKALQGGVNTSQAITGAAQPQITRKSLNPICIPIPPIKEQERIVEVLDAAFEAIDKAKANIERNLANARELFQSRLNDIFSNPSSDWEVKPLGEVCVLQNGFAFKSKEYVHDGVRILRNKNVSIGCLTETDWVCYSKGSEVEYERFLIHKGDFVISMDRPIISDGFKFFWFADLEEPLLLNQRVLRVKPKIEIGSVLNLFFQSDIFATQISPGKSIGVPHISMSDVAEVMITIPRDKSEFEKIEKISALQVECEEIRKKLLVELGNLEELRQSILEQAFEGKLTKPVAA